MTDGRIVYRNSHVTDNIGLFLENDTSSRFGFRNEGNGIFGGAVEVGAGARARGRGVTDLDGDGTVPTSW